MAQDIQEELNALLVNPPKTARGRATLDRIYQSAGQVFSEKGYHNTSVQDITSKANISVGTFYLYFEGKLTLYKYLLLQYGQMIRNYIGERVAECTTRREAERTGIRAWLELIIEHKYIFNITWESLFIDQKLFDHYFSDFSISYARQIKKAQDKGEVADIDPEVLSFALMGITNFVGIHWVFFQENPDLDYLVDQIMRIIEGIFTK